MNDSARRSSVVPTTRQTLRLLNHTAGLLSRKWTLPIAQALDGDIKRYSEIGKALPDATQKVLTETLREMERCGLVYRIMYPTIPPRVEYRLTSVGLGPLTLSTVFSEWFDTHKEDIHRSQKAYDRRKRTRPQPHFGFSERKGEVTS